MAEKKQDRVLLEIVALDLRDMKNRAGVIGQMLRQHAEQEQLASEADKIGALLCALERKTWETLKH